MAGGPDEVTAVTATLIVPVAAFRVVSPEYWATMLLAPTWSCAAPTVMLADADDPAPLALVTVAVTVREPVNATEVAVACKATDADARAEEPARHAVTRL